MRAPVSESEPSRRGVRIGRRSEVARTASTGCSAGAESAGVVVVPGGAIVPSCAT